MRWIDGELRDAGSAEMYGGPYKQMDEMPVLVRQICQENGFVVFTDELDRIIKVIKRRDPEFVYPKYLTVSRDEASEDALDHAESLSDVNDEGDPVVLDTRAPGDKWDLVYDWTLFVNAEGEFERNQYSARVYHPLADKRLRTGKAQRIESVLLHDPRPLERKAFENLLYGLGHADIRWPGRLYNSSRELRRLRLLYAIRLFIVQRRMLAVKLMADQNFSD